MPYSTAVVSYVVLSSSVTSYGHFFGPTGQLVGIFKNTEGICSTNKIAIFKLTAIVGDVADVKNLDVLLPVASFICIVTKIHYLHV